MYRLLLIVLILVLAPLPGFSAEETSDTGRADFRAGIQHFQAGEYDQALVHFRAARRVGMDSDTLTYNLGATYYRLERYEEAGDEFSRLTSNSEFAPVAHYNLGRVAERLGDERKARRQYQRALQGRNERIQDLAALALDGLGEEKPDTGSRLTSVGILGIGYDDNVTLTSEADLIGVSREEDWFLNMLGVVQYQASGERRDGTRLIGALFVRRYQDVHDFHQTALRTGLLRDFRLGEWYTTAGVYLDGLYLGDEYFATTGTLNLEGLRILTPSFGLHLRYNGSYIDGSDDFDSLSGRRHRLRFEGRYNLAATRTTFGYEFEYNDRKDLETELQFLSRSPQRHEFYVEHEWIVTSDWSLSGTAEYRFSRYRDDDVRLTPQGLQEEEREDDQLQLKLRLERDFGRDWTLYTEYTYTENTSNFDTSEYDRNLYLVGLQRVF